MIGRRGTITWGPRALTLFTDRYEAIRGFACYLNDDPARPEIIFFHGDGGNGKSLLLRYLRQHCCKRLPADEWLRAKTLHGDAFKTALEQSARAEAVPVASLDFGMPPQGIDRPREALPALLMLRRSLAGHGLHFPYFDFAAVRYLSAMNHTEAEIKAYFPIDQHGLVGLLIGALSAGGVVAPPATVAAAALAVFTDQLGPWFARYRLRSHLGLSELEDIQALEPQSELIEELPALFSRDLNTTMAVDQAPKRVVLFFDAHEAFQGESGRSSSVRALGEDEWLRRLLHDLDPSSRIVVVVAGRERPRWPLASATPIARERLDYRLVGHLSDAEASAYLHRAGVADDARGVVAPAAADRDREP